MRHPTLARLRALAIALTGFTVSEPAFASDGPDPLVWKPEWPTFSVAEYIVTGVGGALSTAAYFAVKDPALPRWTGGILFDDAARHGLRLRSRSARAAIQTTSDVTAVASVVLVVGVDSLIVPLARKSDFVALQLVLMDAESYVVSSLITTTMFKTTGRARPSYADCHANPNYDVACNTAPTASFPSGHANAAFTSAGLSCAHHRHLPLYDGPVADALGCAAAVTLAASTATFRVMGDRHYASDVIVGGAIGFAIGYAGPTLLHYHVPRRSSEVTAALTPMGGPSTIGLTLSGVF